jgi:hypothetical protein
MADGRAVTLRDAKPMGEQNSVRRSRRTGGRCLSGSRQAARTHETAAQAPATHPDRVVAAACKPIRWRLNGSVIVSASRRCRRRGAARPACFWIPPASRTSRSSSSRRSPRPKDPRAQRDHPPGASACPRRPSHLSKQAERAWRMLIERCRAYQFAIQEQEAYCNLLTNTRATSACGDGRPETVPASASFVRSQPGGETQKAPILRSGLL